MAEAFKACRAASQSISVASNGGRGSQEAADACSPRRWAIRRRHSAVDEGRGGRVVARHIVDQYSARPDPLNNMCLATFAVNYNVCYSISKDDDIAAIEQADEEEEIDNDDIEHQKQFNIQTTITLKHKLGYMRK